MSAPRWKLGETFVLRHAGFPFDWMESLGVSDEVHALALQVLDGQASPKAFETALAEARRPLSLKLREYCNEPKVQEAVLLSNPSMFDNVWKRALSKPPADTADGRRVERQLYIYLQRLCAKNETTSFFGPMGYGALSSEPGGLQVTQPGPQRRMLCFAYWAVGELAKALSRERTFVPDLPLRKNLLFDFGATAVECAPLGVTVPLDAGLGALLQAIDAGAGTLRELAKATGQTLNATEQALRPLLKVTAVLRALPVPPERFDTFEALVASVRALPETPERAAWLTRLESLDARRRAFSDAGLDGKAKALEAWEADFTSLTGQPARRGQGQIYADRYVYYEEASSPFGLKFGRELVEQLETALSPALELSATFGAQVQAERARGVAQALGGEGELDFLEYTVRTRPDTVDGTRFSPVPVQPLPAGAKEVTLEATHLGPSTQGQRYALPDVCLGVVNGEVQVMLARVHHHLLLSSWLTAFHPDASVYEASAKAFVQRASEPALLGLAVRRRNKGFYAYPGPRLLQSVADALEAKPGDLSPRAVKVQVAPQGLTLRLPDGREARLYLALDDFSSFPPMAALAHPQVLHARFSAGLGATPRVRLGGAVYQRARWTLKAQSLAGKKGAALYLELARLGREHGWPRFLFVRSTTERKPYLCDTRSPFMLELLAHLAHDEAGELLFEEMRPGPEALWLKDARGRYTCELRMQATRG